MTAEELTAKVERWVEHIGRDVSFDPEVATLAVAEAYPGEREDLRRTAESSAKSGALLAYTSVLQLGDDGLAALLALPEPPS